MKKRLTLVLGGSAVLLFLFSAAALADGGPHRKYVSGGRISTSCASCHRAHTAAAPMLLTEEQPAMCYACHGETGQGGELNVEGGVEYPSGTTYTLSTTGFSALRGGGFKYAALGAATYGQPIPPNGGSSDPENLTQIANGHIGILTTRAAATSAHSVDPTVDVIMWGNGGISSNPNAGPTVQLTCTSCHDPHGNGNFRILRGIPNDSGATSSVNIVDEIPPTTTPSTPKGYTTTDYWNVQTASGAGWTTSDFVSKVSAWCTTCHTRYLADNFAAKNSSHDSIFTYRHQTNSTAAYSPTCIQCHVSHGTNQTMSRSALTEVTYPDGSGPVPGNSRLLRLPDRAVCQMCHLR